jgi:REP element-mobilizing transposase RayT
MEKNSRPNEPPMPDALAYFFTWGTYGTWLPGDERGWNEYGHGWQPPDPIRKLEAEARMTEDACILDDEQRITVERQIAETCRIRGWKLHAVNCRTNHVHFVVTAPLAPKIVRNQLKAWCTRRLKELEAKRRGLTTKSSSIRENWWAERGSQRFLNDEESLEAAILYVRDGQDNQERYNRSGGDSHQPEA